MVGHVNREVNRPVGYSGLELARVRKVIRTDRVLFILRSDTEARTRTVCIVREARV